MTTPLDIMHAGDDDHLDRMMTGRDIVIKCIAAEHDPSAVLVGELAQGGAHHVDANAGIEKLRAVMAEHQVRRLRAIDNHRLAGIVSEADIARHLPGHAIAQSVKAICAEAAITSP